MKKKGVERFRDILTVETPVKKGGPNGVEIESPTTKITGTQFAERHFFKLGGN